MGPFLLLVILIILSAFFSSAETAIMALDAIRVKALVRDKKKYSQTLYKLKNDPEKLLITILIGNNLVNIGASAIATSIAISYFGSIGIGISTGLMTFIILTFGEIIPKTFALRNPEKMALIYSRFLLFFQYLFYPFIYLFKAFIMLLNQFIRPRKKGEFSLTEFQTFLDAGYSERKIGFYEKRFIEGSLRFKKLRVKDIYLPLKQVFALSIDTPIEKAIALSSKRKYSRIPIYEKHRNNIVGMIVLKDLLIKASKNELKSLKQILRKPIFFHKDLSLEEAFFRLKSAKTHLAIVVDEKDKPIGIITLEQILEEVVGEIWDEKDSIPFILKKYSDNDYLIDIDASIQDIIDIFDVYLRIKNKEQSLKNYLLNRFSGDIPINKDIKMGKLLLNYSKSNEQAIRIRKPLKN